MPEPDNTPTIQLGVVVVPGPDDPADETIPVPIGDHLAGAVVPLPASDGPDGGHPDGAPDATGGGAGEPDGEGEPDAAAPAGRGGRLRGALMWAYVLNTGGYAITALLSFVLAAILEPRAFGVLAMAMVFINLAQSLLHHGPTMAVIQQDDITDDHFNAAFWSTLGGAFVFSALLAATAPLWAALNRLPDLTLVTVSLAPIVLIHSLAVIPDAWFRRRMQMRSIAIRTVVSNLAGGVVGVGCAVAGLGVWSLVAQQLFSVTLYVAILWTMTPWRPRLRSIRAPLRDIQRSSIQTTFAAIGNFVATRTDVLLMGAFFGPLVVGLYRFASRFADMAVDLTGRGLQDVSLPHLARHHKDPHTMAREFGRIMHTAGVLSFPTLGILAAVAEPLVLFIGDQWAQSAAALRVLCLVSAVGMVNSLLGPAVQATQRSGLTAIFTWSTAVGSAGGLSLAAWLSASSGTLGKLYAVAWVALAVQALTMLAQGYVLFRHILRVSPAPVLTAALPSVFAGLVGFGTGTVLTELTTFDIPALFRLAAIGTITTAVTGGVLLAVDGWARSMALRVLRRLTRRRTAPAPAGT